MEGVRNQPAVQEPPQRTRPDAADRSRRRATYDGGMDTAWTAVVWALLPTLVVAGLFWFVLRGILRMDRTERRVHARIEAEERAKRGLPPVAGDAGTGRNAG